MMPKDARIIPRITPNPRTNAMMRNIIPIQINVDIFSPPRDFYNILRLTYLYFVKDVEVYQKRLFLGLR